VEEQRTANVVLSADVSQYQQSVKEASATTDQLAASIDKISKSLSAISKTAGKSLVGLGAGSAAGLTGATMAAGKFEKSLSTLNAQAALTNKNMGALRGTVLDLSKQFPVSLNQSAQLVTMISQMGVATEQQINRMSSALVKLSGATGSDLMAVSTGLVELGRTMGTLNATNIDKYANALVNVSTGSGVAAQSVLEFSNAIGPVARLAGMTEETVLGVSGAFAKAGADGYAGATAFNRLVYGLTRTLQFGGPELKTYSNLLGVTSDQLRSMDPGEAVLQIFENLNKQGPLAIKTLDSLGLDGLRTIRSIQAVINQGNLRQSVNQAMFGSDGSLGTGAEAAFSGLNDEVERFGTNIQQFGIAIGQNLTTPLEGAFAVANQLMSVMNALANSPIGTAAALATGGIGAVAGTVGMGLLGAKALGQVVTAGMAGGVLRAGWGGMRLGQGIETGAASRAQDILTRPRVGMARFQPSYLLAQAGYGMGGWMGQPDTESPSRLSRWAATPIRAATWMTEGQRSFINNSNLMQQGPFAQANKLISESFKDFRTAMLGSAAATKSATGGMVGLGQATGNLSRSIAMLGMTYGRAGLATGGMALRGLGGLAMNTLGPAGMVIAGGLGIASAAQYAGGLAAERTQNYGDLGANLYANAAGRSGTASMAPPGFTTVELGDLTPASSRSSAAAISSSEYQLTTSPSFELTDPALAGMSAEEAKRYVLSLGYLPVEDMQMVGQDLASLFGTAKASEILNESISAYPKQKNSLRSLVQGQGLPGVIPTGGAQEYQILSGTYNASRETVNPISKDFWREFFGGLTEEQSALFETANEQLLAQTTEITNQYGTQAGDVFKTINELEMLLSADTGAERNKVESLIGGDWNYPGLDPTRGEAVSSEDAFQAWLGRQNESGQTYGQFFNRLGYTFSPDIAEANPSYEYIDLENPTERRRVMLEMMRADPSQSEFQKTAVGGFMSRPKMTMKIAQEDANTQLAVAQQILSYAEQQPGGAISALREARGGTSSQSPDFQALSLAMQLEQRRFDQNLALSNMNSFSTQNAQMARTQQVIASLNPEDENYEQDLMQYQDMLIAQQTQLRDSYESVILAHREFNISMERSDEEYGIARTRAVDDYNQQIEWAYEDFYRNRRRAQADFDRSMNRMVEDSMATVYDPYSRIQTQPTLDAGNLMLNIEEQNRALEQQEKNLRKLRKAGVSQDTIDFLGLADPRNAQQLARLLADIQTDPKLIKEINRLTAGRESATDALVGSHWSRQYRRAVDDFERQSRRARDDFNRQMERNNELFNKQLSRMAEDHKRMTENALEDFNRQFKEVTGKFGSIEQRALQILGDAGVKVVAEGERQMDRIIRSLTRKYNFTMRMIDRLQGMEGGSGGGGASANTGAVSAPGRSTTSSYGGAGVTITNSGSSTTAPTVRPSTRVDASKLNKKENRRLNKRNKFLDVAYDQLGDPYVWGTEGPDTFDCSGLVAYAANKAGLNVGRLTADGFIRSSKPISAASALPGDLIAFEWGDGDGRWDHIGIYAGSGRMIHAPNSRSNVMVSNINDQGAKHIKWGRLKGMALGGVATQRTVTEIAEAGYPEAVIPLNNRGHDYMTGMYKAISRELVKEITTKQLRLPTAGFSGGNQYINASTQITGDITVKADDPGEMLKKIEAKKRRDALLRAPRSS
jgi:TP901 family phage tail tape measure protein